MKLPPGLQSRLAIKKNQDGPWPRVRRPYIAALTWAGSVVAAWSVASLFLYVYPVLDQPAHSDAVVVLAPVSMDRLVYAESLMSAGYAETLVISVPETGNSSDSSELCHVRRPYRVICFSPDPVTTRGEARAIRRLSDEHGWRSINVATSESHVTRARIVIGRCYSDDLNMLAVREDSSLKWWAYRFIYETAAFVKVVGERGC